jgi:hypothetical protein
MRSRDPASALQPVQCGPERQLTRPSHYVGMWKKPPSDATAGLHPVGWEHVTHLLAPADVASSGLQAATDEAQQCALADAVRADKAQPAAACWCCWT